MPVLLVKHAKAHGWRYATGSVMLRVGVHVATFRASKKQPQEAIACMEGVWRRPFQAYQ